MVSIDLAEWESCTPTNSKQLVGLSFDGQPTARLLAQQLDQKGWLTIQELRQGLEISTNSFIGTITLGDLHINIVPKVNFDILRTLLRYAYQLRDLQLLDQTTHAPATSTFQYLLIRQLAAEAENLLARGIHRQYKQVSEALASPRGRINIQKIASQGGVIEARLPCQHYPRHENNVLNVTIHAGLLFATRLTTDLLLRSHLRRLASRLELTLEPRTLNHLLLQQAQQALNRLTAAYAPAIRLTDLLYGGAGLASNSSESTTLQLPGFLFDMNIFFERLITQFLHDNLVHYQIQPQHRLTGMMTYHPAHNPRNRYAPTPRPDIALLQNGTVAALLDTKYRDLWEKPLPRDMLYQLAIYALSQPKFRKATILYPTLSQSARLQRIEIRDPISALSSAQVCLQPVHLPTLADIVNLPGVAGERIRTKFACELIGQIG